MSGPGWAYVAEFDRLVGSSPRVIADTGALADLWLELGGVAEPPPVSFDTDIVLAIEVGHSGSCPETRLDAIETQGSLVFTTIVHTSRERACTSDYIPRTYLVTVARNTLPAPPFQVTSGADVLQRTNITADLWVASTDCRSSQTGPSPRTSRTVPGIRCACGVSSITDLPRRP